MQPHNVSFLAPHQAVNKSGIGAASLDDMMSPKSGSAISNGDVVQLLQLERHLRAQAEQLSQAADQLAALRARASTSSGRA